MFLIFSSTEFINIGSTWQLFDGKESHLKKKVVYIYNM